MLKKSGLLILVLSLLVSAFIPFNSLSEAKEQDEQVKTEKLDLSSVKNLDEVLKNLNLSKNDVLDESYRIPSDNTAIVNVEDKDNSSFYNLYVEGDKITSYSTQQSVNNNKAEFNLYDMNGEIIYTSVVDENGQEVSESTPAANDTKVRESGNVNKAALAWACLFSSKVACVGAAAGVAGGAMLIGPWGAAITGSAAGSACEMLFTTLVEKYGGKDAACSAEGAMNS